MYQFGNFTLQLNYLPDQLIERLPHTDSRLRPDQKAMENGELDFASKEKDRLEELQRNRRKVHEKNGTQHEPAYFEKVPVMGGDGNETLWKFNGNYWEDRHTKNWSRLINIYDD